jgi:hypothetical protein
VEQDYTVYVHALGAGGDLLGQVDRQPQAGAYPTSIWAPGEVVADSLQVPVADPRAVASLRIGLYRLETGDSLGEVVIDLP